MEKLAYSVSELATLLGIGRNVAYELCQREDFPAIVVGQRRIVIPCQALTAWLERQAMGVAQ